MSNQSTTDQPAAVPVIAAPDDAIALCQDCNIEYLGTICPQTDRVYGHTFKLTLSQIRRIEALGHAAR